MDTPRTSTLSLPLQPRDREAVSLEAGLPANLHQTTQLPRHSRWSFPRPAQPSRNTTWPTVTKAEVFRVWQEPGSGAQKYARQWTI